MMDNILTKKLPNGQVLAAELNNDPSYPGIQISLMGTGPDGTDETLCFAEFNTGRTDGKQLCICAYTADQDDPAYYASYHDPESAKEPT